MNQAIVTIDGPSGTGKSSVAQQLAQRLGFAFLDTGAMYRGLTAVCLDKGVDLASGEAVSQLARRVSMRYDWTTNPPVMEVDGRDVTDRLRDPDVGRKVSDVAQIPEVREVLVEAQRRIAEEVGQLVTDGRDQGSVVFPDAAMKFYLDAEPAVRARRRFEQLRRSGREADERAIMRMMESRDQRDVTRPTGPLVCADDAEHIDTSHISMEEVVALLEKKTRARFARVLDVSARAAGAVDGSMTGGRDV